VDGAVLHERTGHAQSRDLGDESGVGTTCAGCPTTAPATCTGVHGRACSWRIWYADVADTLIRYNSSVVTG
jgi:hypothetical protein